MCVYVPTSIACPCGQSTLVTKQRQAAHIRGQVCQVGGYCTHNGWQRREACTAVIENSGGKAKADRLVHHRPNKVSHLNQRRSQFELVCIQINHVESHNMLTSMLLYCTLAVLRLKIGRTAPDATPDSPVPTPVYSDGKKPLPAAKTGMVASFSARRASALLLSP